MSRIGKKPITIPQGVKVAIDGQNIKVTGPKGELNFRHRSAVEVAKTDTDSSLGSQEILVKLKRDDNFGQSVHGTTRSIIANMVTGVTQGFSKKLDFFGVGFKAEAREEEGKKKLILTLGFSHPVEIVAPENIEFKVEKNVITVSGIDKEKVGEVAAHIKRIKPVEPYKGKGIKYIDEVVRRKVGKAVERGAEEGGKA
jgi:large subunit ribosomal protein L6